MLKKNNVDIMVSKHVFFLNETYKNDAKDSLCGLVVSLLGFGCYKFHSLRSANKDLNQVSRIILKTRRVPLLELPIANPL